MDNPCIRGRKIGIRFLDEHGKWEYNKFVRFMAKLETYMQVNRSLKWFLTVAFCALK
ncbi:hypothetical protein [Thalassobacillus sp. C254]|uniref:hypothetical protein n=1 Tax=Thalassobacillus sp. C254 TaxID=1225341 RepID=UPI0018DCBA49|nr:hypothetical protein [Thalassobacillus sp. C254]